MNDTRWLDQAKVRNRTSGKTRPSRAQRVGALIRWVAATLVALCMPAAALAQSTTTYVNSTTGNINNTTTCTAPLVRNFSVGASFTIGSVELGVFATHTYRGDLRITLQAPDGTRVQLVNGNANGVSGDNFNVRLSGSAPQTVNTDSPSGNHSTTAPPPFANTFAPDSSLSAFAGKNSLGTWRMEICDIYPSADNGSFRYAELYLTSAPASYADLSLTKAVSNPAPANGTAITYTLTVSNSAASASAATGVQVTDVLPAGVAYVSHTATGTSYAPATGLWAVGTLTPGQSRTLTITATVSAMASATVTNVAEVTASSVIDLDSTPNNGLLTEDDYAAASFTVLGARIAGTAPTLTCPAGSTLFDWDLNPWPANSLSNSFVLANIGTIGFTSSSPGTWTGSPVLNTSTTGGNNGGLAGSQLSLFQSLDFATAFQTATTTITLPTAVPGLQFRVFDVDYAANDFADQLTVSGSYNGSPVTPTLTNGVNNYVVGNTAYGDTGNSTATSSDGNVVVTFSSPVDTIVIVYGNHNSVPSPASNPDGQAISIWDITFCNPVAVLGVTKVSTLISDPTNGTTNPRAIPGAVMEYCILVQNPGSATATNVIGTDVIPAALTYTAGSLLSGTTCAGATNAEDDNATGADESDPYGASISGSTLTATAPSLGPGSGFALKFRTTVN